MSNSPKHASWFRWIAVAIMIGFLTILTTGAIRALSKKESKLEVTKQGFGLTEDNQIVDIFTLSNSNGVEARIMEYGGILVSLKVPDRNGKIEDVVLGFNDLDKYLSGHPYFSTITGRYANRIDEGQFTLDGETYQLAQNNNQNHLHGGNEGFDKKVWSGHAFRTTDSVGVEMSYFSENGEENYPGNLAVTVRFSLNNQNELRIDYSAITDEKTVLNLTYHPYFNLDGVGDGAILDHEMMINADQLTPVDKTLIPTGELREVKGTPFDFRTPHPIGERINSDNQQLKYGKGYDHNFVLNSPGEYQTLDARVYEPDSGRIMEVYTSEPGMQFYSGNFLDGSLTGKGHSFEHRSGFALEAQHFPDSPNQPNFPTTVLEPGERYTQTTIYKFIP